METRSLKEGQIKDFVAEIFKCSSKVKIIFVGLAGKYDTVDRIRQDHPSSTLNLMGKTSLSDLFYILERADAVVTVDSGPMHIAAHVESKIYAVFGPTSPERAGYRDHVISRGACPYFPCESSRCKIETNQCITEQDLTSLAREVAKQFVG